MAETLTGQVTRVVEQPRMLLNGNIERDVRVEFTIGPHGPFTLTLPRAEFTADRVKQEMAKLAAEISQLPTGR
jgi:hypothetical protein